MAAEQIDMGNAIIDSLLGLVPPLMVGGVFYVIMRSILRADSKERKVYAQIEAEERAKLAAGTSSISGDGIEQSKSNDAGSTTKAKRK